MRLEPEEKKNDGFSTATYIFCILFGAYFAIHLVAWFFRSIGW